MRCHLIKYYIHPYITQAVGIEFHTSLSLAQAESGSFPDAFYTIISPSLPICNRKVDNIVYVLANTVQVSYTQ